MRRGIGCAAVVAVALAAPVSSASADYLCVPDISIPGCPAGAANEPTISDAVTNGHPGDTILIGAGTYTEPVLDMGTTYHFVGAGPTKTLIQAPGSPGASISGTSTLSNLGIEVHPTDGNTGLNLAGTADHVAITAQPGVTYAVGLDLNGGTFSHGSVSLPLSVSEPAGYGGVVGKGTMTDSNVSAAVGISADSSGNTPNLARDRIVANQGILVGGAQAPSVDDSLVRTVPGVAAQLGIGTSPSSMYASFDMRHTTVIGTGATGSTGVSAVADGLTLPATSNVLLESSIVRGYATSVSAAAFAGSFSAKTTVTVRHSFYDPAASQASTNATIAKDSHSGNLNPLFVNQAAGDFRLQAGSPAIDAGETTLGTGESSTDFDGHPRLIAGRRGDAAISDVGAFEFRPHAPSVHAGATALKILPGKKDTFHAAASDSSPGDAVSLHWSFGDGGSAAGPSVVHAFAKAGRHHVTVTATDLDRFTATAALVVTVPGPAISKLAIAPRHIRPGHGALITYTASQAATTNFIVLRSKTGRLVTKLERGSHAGKNHLHFAARAKGRPLAPGHYRLVAVPHNSAGVGRAVSVNFTITG